MNKYSTKEQNNKIFSFFPHRLQSSFPHSPSRFIPFSREFIKSFRRGRWVLHPTVFYSSVTIGLVASPQVRAK